MDVVHIYSGILLSLKKKNEILSFAATWMDLEITILNNVETERHMISITCGI